VVTSFYYSSFFSLEQQISIYYGSVLGLQASSDSGSEADFDDEEGALSRLPARIS
jgi:hypothetical protein